MGTPEVWAAYKGRPLIHTSTFGGNPLACAAARATLDVIQSEGLCERAAASGLFLLSEMVKLAAVFPALVKEVRGLGLMIGLELHHESDAGALISELVKQNVLAVYTLNQPRVLRFEPPLQISPSQLEGAVAALAKGLQAISDRASAAPLLKPAHGDGPAPSQSPGSCVRE